MALWAGLGIAAGGGLLAAAPPATIAISPALPSASDSVELSVTGDPTLCWSPILTWDPPVIQGSTVVLQAHVPPGPLPPGCTYPWPQRFTVAPLAAGPYSAEFRLGDTLMAAQAFDVSTPTTELALDGARFRAVARLADPATASERAAAAVQLGDDSGYFWFFANGNVELTIKLLDGRAVNGHFWVFIASMTDVANTVEVTDTSITCVRAPCGVRSYAAVAGHNTNFIDTQAF